MKFLSLYTALHSIAYSASVILISPSYVVDMDFISKWMNNNPEYQKNLTIASINTVFTKAIIQALFVEFLFAKYILNLINAIVNNG